MKLIPFSSQYLRLDDPLPFGLREATGRLLLAAGQKVPSAGRLEELKSQPLYAEEHEAADWNRRLAAAVDTALRRNSSLKAVAAARPDAMSPREAHGAAPQAWPELWHELVTQLDGALREVQAGGEWRSRLLAVHARARQLYQRRPDASLYCLVHETISSTRRYSCLHALLVMCICEDAGGRLAWPAEWIDSLGRAALAMNVATLRLQDQLASSPLCPTPAMLAEIAAHPQAGADLLRCGGLEDALCEAVVRLHRLDGDPLIRLAALPPERQLAQLLRRVDVFTAKISLRASRAPMSPVQAAREACLVAEGRPDEIGTVLLKAIGLYPPGCFVGLAGGEQAIVLARGRSANQPVVATLLSASGMPLGVPALRDTSDARYAIKAALPPSAVKVRPSHERLLALR